MSGPHIGPVDTVRAVSVRKRPAHGLVPRVVVLPPGQLV